MECTVHKLVADVAVIADGHVLFVRYLDTAPYDGQEGWFLPDDYLLHGEHPEDAARRILEAQAGFEPKSIRLSHIESFVGGAGDAWHLVFHFAADIDEKVQPAPGENVRDAQWFPLGKLPDRRSVAHHGWGLEVLEEVVRRA